MISTLKALLWVRSFVIVVFIWGIYAAVKGHQRTCMFAYSLVCFVPFLFLVLAQDFCLFFCLFFLIRDLFQVTRCPFIVGTMRFPRFLLLLLVRCIKAKFLTPYTYVRRFPSLSLSDATRKFTTRYYEYNFISKECEILVRIRLLFFQSN